MLNYKIYLYIYSIHFGPECNNLYSCGVLFFYLPLSTSQVVDRGMPSRYGRYTENKIRYFKIKPAALHKGYGTLPNSKGNSLVS